MKNIIFIPYIKREKNLTGESSIGHSNRHQGYEYGINSWKAWAKKNGHEVYIMSDLLCPESEMLITWQRWQVLNILEHNEIEYDQVLVVDADSVVHPDCNSYQYSVKSWKHFCDKYDCELLVLEDLLVILLSI